MTSLREILHIENQSKPSKELLTYDKSENKMTLLIPYDGQNEIEKRFFQFTKFINHEGFIGINNKIVLNFNSWNNETKEVWANRVEKHNYSPFLLLSFYDSKKDNRNKISFFNAINLLCSNNDWRTNEDRKLTLADLITSEDLENNNLEMILKDFNFFQNKLTKTDIESIKSTVKTYKSIFIK